MQVVKASLSIGNMELEQLIPKIAECEISDVASVAAGAACPFVSILPLAETSPVWCHRDEAALGEFHGVLLLIILDNADCAIFANPVSMCAKHCGCRVRRARTIGNQDVGGDGRERIWVKDNFLPRVAVKLRPFQRFHFQRYCFRLRSEVFHKVASEFPAPVLPFGLRCAVEVEGWRSFEEVLDALFCG